MNTDEKKFLSSQPVRQQKAIIHPSIHEANLKTQHMQMHADSEKFGEFRLWFRKLQHARQRINKIIVINQSIKSSPIHRVCVCACVGALLRRVRHFSVKAAWAVDRRRNSRRIAGTFRYSRVGSRHGRHKRPADGLLLTSDPTAIRSVRLIAVNTLVPPEVDNALFQHGNRAGERIVGVQIRPFTRRTLVEKSIKRLGSAEKSGFQVELLQQLTLEHQIRQPTVETVQPEKAAQTINIVITEQYPNTR
ncbi:hypothetical protein Tsp_10335 [Trichinella spiralis]|uniref:hypothetical protein n=1 Tax=Trichinella spiralis TaxID=6334 RepID=UPI0001EFE380|nr:hypothetical protein Tsp_10335 [Trichinella spiralis]